MSPRPRTTTDDEILSGVVRAMERVGPLRLALTDVAGETGLAPATLLQRFGSKRGMLLAALERMAAPADRQVEEIRSRYPSRVAALVALAGVGVRDDDTPATVANRIAFFHGELGDADVHRVALERSRRAVAGFRALIAEAIAAGELASVDAGRLAQWLHAAVTGAALEWAISREGPARRWVEAAAEWVLTPYRQGGPAGIGAAAGEMARPAAGPRARHKL
jgi:AcrR family transcriptional regulator